MKCTADANFYFTCVVWQPAESKAEPRYPRFGTKETITAGIIDADAGTWTAYESIILIGGAFNLLAAGSAAALLLAF